ncbi:hypothetical protein MKX03_036128 [Papaver bracteatum]|nr:hypothetical protein MKX03_036128 [Papaver bracteatum]
MSILHKLVTFIFMFILYPDQMRTAQAQESTPLYLAWHWCSGSNYTVNSTYETNLNILLSSLSTTFTNNNTIIQNGYRNITIGKTSDAVYGSLHCREDIAPAICSACVQGATRQVVKNSMCPSSKEAIMYYNGCVLRYSDKYYFSKLDEEPEFAIVFFKMVTNPATYLTLVTGLLDDLVIQVVNNTSRSPSLFATGETNYTRQNKLYGMVQCTPDLTPSICATCLRSAIAQLSDCCYGHQAARFLYPSCTFRFQTDPFYGQSIYASTPATPPTPPFLTPSTLQANTTTFIMQLLFPIILVIFILCS